MQMKKISLLICAVLLICTAYSQKVIISGKEGSRPLKWADFTGDPDNSSSFFANTYWQIATQAADIKPAGDSVLVGKFLVTLQLDPVHSWVKAGRQTDELLAHEQGHFDAGILCMRECISLCEGKKFSKKNFNKELQTIFDRTFKKYTDLGKQYDDETDHSKNKEQQLKWHQFFEEKLAGK